MPDYVKGTVEQILAEDRILVQITFVGNTNRAEYEDIEAFTIAKLEPPFLKNIPQSKQIARLEKKLLGETVYCYLLGKLESGEYKARVVCDGAKFRGKRKRI